MARPQGSVETWGRRIRNPTSPHRGRVLRSNRDSESSDFAAGRRSAWPESRREAQDRRSKDARRTACGGGARIGWVWRAEADIS